MVQTSDIKNSFFNKSLDKLPKIDPNTLQVTQQQTDPSVIRLNKRCDNIAKHLMTNKNFLSIEDIAKFKNVLIEKKDVKSGFFSRTVQRINNLFSFSVWATNNELAIAVMKLDKAPLVVDEAKTKRLILENFQKQIISARNRMIGTQQYAPPDDQQLGVFVKCAEEVLKFKNGELHCDDFLGQVDRNSLIKGIKPELKEMFFNQLNSIVGSKNREIQQGTENR